MREPCDNLFRILLFLAPNIPGRAAILRSCRSRECRREHRQTLAWRSRCGCRSREPPRRHPCGTAGIQAGRGIVHEVRVVGRYRVTARRMPSLIGIRGILDAYAVRRRGRGHCRERHGKRCAQSSECLAIGSTYWASLGKTSQNIVSHSPKIVLLILSSFMQEQKPELDFRMLYARALGILERGEAVAAERELREIQRRWPGEINSRRVLALSLLAQGRNAEGIWHARSSADRRA